jgi:hypothetical protein
MNEDGVNVYHVVVATGDPAGIHKRVSLEAETLEQAQELFAARYGKDNVVSVWGDYEAEKRRGYSI